MGLGMTEASGAVATPDGVAAGDLQWSTTSGINAGHPVVTGQRGGPAFDPDAGFGSRMVTLPPAEAAAANGSVAGGPTAAVLDDWRDLFNFKGSPMPWLLLLSLAALGFVQLSLSGRAGPARAAAAIG